MNKLLKNDKFMTLLSQGMYSLNSFIIVFFLARFFSKDFVGDYAILNSIMLMFIVAPIAFISMPLMSSIIKGPESIPESFIMLIAIIVLSLPVYFITTKYLFGFETKAVAASFVYMVALFIYEVVRRYIYIESLGISAGIEIIRFIVTTLVVCILFRNVSFDQLWFGLITSFIIPFGYFLYRYKYNFIKRKIEVNALRRCCEFGVWIFITNLLQAFSGSMYIYITGLLLSKEAVAGVAVARSLIGYTTVIMLSIDSVMSRKLSLAYKEYEKKKFIILFRSQVVRLFSIYSVVCIPVFIFSDEILSIIFGDHYASYGIILGLLLVNTSFVFLYKLLSLYFRTIGDTRPIFFSSLPGIFLVLTICYFAVLYYGVIGGVLLLIASQLSSVFCLFIYIWKSNGKTSCLVTK